MDRSKRQQDSATYRALNPTGLIPVLETPANAQPAFGLYIPTPDGDFVPFQLQVVELDGERVKHVTAFFDLTLFPKFGLPERLPADHAPATT